MEYNELIQERRSIRKYKEQEIEKSVIDELIDEAIEAPSWKNSQTPRYYVALSKEAKDKVYNALPEFNQNNSANASALIVTTFIKNRSGFERDGTPTNELGNSWGAYDLGLSNMLFMLSAKNRGLDTLVMGIRNEKSLRDIFDIDEDETVVSVIALGYRNIDPQKPIRKNMGDISTFL